jgi:hypothetical protein
MCNLRRVQDRQTFDPDLSQHKNQKDLDGYKSGYSRSMMPTSYNR